MFGSKHPSEPQPSARCPFLWSASPGLVPKKKALVPSSLSQSGISQTAVQPSQFPGGRLCHQASCHSDSSFQSSLYCAVTVPKPWFHWQPILLLNLCGVGVRGVVVIALVGCVPAVRRSLHLFYLLSHSVPVENFSYCHPGRRPQEESSRLINTHHWAFCVHHTQPFHTGPKCFERHKLHGDAIL